MRVHDCLDAIDHAGDHAIGWRHDGHAGERQALARGGPVLFIAAVAACGLGTDRLEQAGLGITEHALKVVALVH
jgi:hypothetical protein